MADSFSDEEILAGMRTFDETWRASISDKYNAQPATRNGIREAFFRAGVEWAIRQIKADSLTSAPDDDSEA